jgi:hypothetical protein
MRKNDEKHFIVGHRLECPVRTTAVYEQPHLRLKELLPQGFDE